MQDEPPRPREAFASFAAFYTFYLSQHTDRTSRRLHLVGTSLGLVCLVLLLLTGNPAWLFAALLSGYGFAWIGHALFEKNLPATFSHPLYSLAGDLRMSFEMLTGRLPL